MLRPNSGSRSYFHNILYAVFLVMLRSGASREAIESISKRALASARARLRSKLPDDPQLSMAVSGVLHSWHHQAEFIDKRGQPKPLGQRGPKWSLVRLVRCEDSRITPADVIRALKRLRLIRRTAKGQFLPTRRIATIRALDPVLAEHVCHSLGRLLETVSKNTCSSAPRARLIERSAQVQDLPRQRLEEFREYANSQGDIFVSNINDWLEARRPRGGSAAQRTARAGVHVFAFTEPVSNSHGSAARPNSSARRATHAG